MASSRRNPRKRQRIGCAILLLVVAGALLYVIRAAVGEQLAPGFYRGFEKQTLVDAVFDRNFVHLLWKHSFATVLVLWVFAFGASIGSFLNVVVYRMPRGESINKRGSHCPYCNNPIRLRDNLPVFGWLNLRGRCHVCRLPISSRYPVVEFLTGAMFVCFFMYEVGSGGKFLPGFQTLISRDGLIGIFSRNFEDYQFLIGIFAFHIACVIVLWAALLIERDRKRMPWKLFIVPMLISLIAAIVWPNLLVVSWFEYSSLCSQSTEWQQTTHHFSTVIGLVIGTGHGFLIGWLFDRREHDRLFARRSIFALACGYVGLAFGWQAILSISLPLTIGLFLVRSSQTGNRDGRGVDRYTVLFTCVVVHWVFWKAMHGPFESKVSGAPYVLYGLIAVAFAAIVRFPIALPTRQRKPASLPLKDEISQGEETIGPAEDTIAPIVFRNPIEQEKQD